MNRTVVIPISPFHRRIYAVPKLRKLLDQELIRVLGLIALHALLALALTRSSIIATAHAGVTLVAGIWVAAFSPSLERAAIFGAYVTGAEVLWRMTNAYLPWEFGKYAIILVFLLALLRTGKVRGPLPAFLFFGLLLPSLVLPLVNVPTEVLIDQLRFNLSGPLALMVSVWFFSHVKLAQAQLHRVLLALVCPAIAVAIIAFKGIVTAKELVFVDDSNFATSGGYGPNQVSAVLGLGALAAVFWALDNKLTRSLKILLFAVAVYLAAQCAMTFSRTGLYLAVGGTVLTTLFLIRDRRTRMQLVGGLIILVIVVVVVVVPLLDNYTGGALTKRFSDTQGSGREHIMMEDLRIFSENPIFGVGPGQAKFQLRGTYGEGRNMAGRVAAHNEFARLLAEHGIGGVLAILVLLYMGIQNFKKARSAKGRALTTSMAFWSFGFLFSTAMRIVAPSFIFGLATAFVLPEEESSSSLHR